MKLLCALVIAAFGLPAMAADEVKTNGVVLKGSPNVVVEIANLKSGDALVKVTGVDSAWDGKIQKVTVSPAGIEGKDYTLTHNGKPYNMLVQRAMSWSGAELYLPDDDIDGGTSLYIDSEASAKARPEALLKAYERQ